MFTPPKGDFTAVPLNPEPFQQLLDSGGKEMKVQTTIQTPQGEQNRNVVYTKS